MSRLLAKVLGKGGSERKGPLTGKPLNICDVQVDVGSVLGEGGFATVYRVIDVLREEPLALKHFQLGGNPDAARAVKDEVAIMRALQPCPHVLRLHAVAFSGPKGAEQEAVLLMDLAAGSLPAHLAARGYKLDDGEVLAIFLPICRAIHAMHSLSPPVAHRDIKAENLLLMPSGDWQLCDFGSASTRHGVLEGAAEISYEEEVVRRTTTPAYRAPELWDLWSRQPIGLPSDIWALGCLLYLLCYGALPFDSNAKLSILNARYIQPEGRPAPLRKLVARLLMADPLARPDIHQLVAAVEGLAAAIAPDVARMLLPTATAAIAAQQHRRQQQQTQPAGQEAGMVVASRQRIRSESQDWRDLATSRQPGLAPAEAPAAAAAANTKFDTLGWASFDSPKQEQQPQQPVTAGTPAAAAGLFWERFGGDGDGEAEPGAPESAPTAPAKPLVPVPQTRAPASASAPATCAAPRPVSPPPPPPHAAAGPLSAGMGQLQHRLPGSSSAVNSDPGEAPTSVYLSGGSGADLPLLGGSASEVEQLRSTVTQLQEHAQVLESLLENRNTETADLRAEVDRLRRQLAAAQALIGVQQQQQQQQQPLGGSRHINPPIPGLAITPPGAVDLATSSRSAVDAPTPTFPGARPQNGGVPRPTGGYATSAPNTCRQATATLPGTEELRNRLGGMGLSSHPVAFTPGSAINSSSGGSAGTINTVLPPSLQRFSQTSHSGSTRPPSTSSGQSTPSQPGSPMRQRASSGGGGGGAGRPPSPTKVPHHARTFSAPNSLFADLDPLK